MTNVAISEKASSRPRILNPEGTVFATFSALSNRYGAINMSQGFPALPTPGFIKESLVKAAQSDDPMMYQYARSQGLPDLVERVSAFYGDSFGKRLEGMDEILVTQGASQAICSTFFALVEPGDEVVLMRPYYDLYPSAAAMAGATIKYLDIKPARGLAPGTHCTENAWTIDAAELEALISPRTKMILLNNPHNPLGKVFSRSELEMIASVAKKHDLLVLSDEVYDQIVYEGQHTRMASLPGMWDRTITVGSVGKTFQTTGLKVGWCIGPRPIIRAIWLFHQFDTFTISTPLQHAVAECFKRTATDMKSFFENKNKEFQGLRDMFVKELESCPHLFKHVFKPEAGYFVTTELTETSLGSDDAWCRWLVKEHGVASIPCSALSDERYVFREGSRRPDCEEGGKQRLFVRWACCKPEDTLKKVGEVLRGVKQA